MTHILGLFLILTTFFPSFGWADCASYYQELNKKILAHQTQGLISSAEEQNNFVTYLLSLKAKNRQTFLKKLMELAKKDFDLAQDFTVVLNRLTEKNLLMRSELEEIIAVNGESKIVFHLDQNLKSSFTINLSPEAITNAAMIPELKWVIINLNLPLETQQRLVNTLLEIKTVKNQDLVNHALNYMSSLSEVDRMSLALQFKQILDIEPTHKLFKRFRKNLTKFSKYESRVLKEMQKEIREQNPKLSEEEIFSQAKNASKEQRKIYENLSYGCKGNSGVESEEQKIAANKFRRFKSIMGMATNITMYSYFNWDKEKDFTWFAKFGYDISMGQAMNYVNSKIVTNNKDSYFMKSLKNYGVYSVSDLGSSLLYSKIFGDSNEDIETLLAELQKDPNFKEEMKKLHKVLDDAKANENLVNRMEYLFTDKEFDPEKITPKDLESPEMRELFLELIAKRIYYENMGGVIQTGSPAYDRFAFSRLYGVVASTKGMAINLVIYNILCMGGANPALAYLKAGSVFIIDNLITCYYYYKFRREMINQ